MFSQNEEANEIVDIDMLKISDAVGSSIDNFNISVILFGSYCKGEGGFVDGKLVNDYDLLLITDTKKEADDITEIILELGLQNKADIQWTTNEKIKNLPCTQQVYEIAKSIQPSVIIIEDIDAMENLGIYEVDEEDFALCEYISTSKINIQSVVRNGLDIIRKEMS